jgi:hypothetical protein
MLQKNCVIAIMLLLATSCTRFGNDNYYVIDGRFVREQISDSEYVIECDHAPDFDQIALDRYVKTGAAALALQKGYPYFTCNVDVHFGPPLIRPVYYVCKVKLYKENPPLDAINAEQFLEHNPIEMQRPA